MLTKLPVIGTYSGVGSRKAPPEILDRFERCGKVLCDLGYRGRSGLAPGPDLSFYLGAQRSERFDEIGFDNFLPNDWLFKKPEFGGFVHDPSKRIYNAKLFANYAQACEIAFQARGSWNGLKQGGIDLHCRNAYQPLGEDLIEPSKFMLLYAIPIGAKTHTDKCKVQGGTNTAVQIAYRYNIPTFNLWWPEMVDRIDKFLAKHE